MFGPLVSERVDAAAGQSTLRKAQRRRARDALKDFGSLQFGDRGARTNPGPILRPCLLQRR